MDDTKRIEYLKKLNNRDVSVRRDAIYNLGRLDDPQVIKILTGYFSETHPDIRSTLLKIFSEKQNRRTAEVVADSLHSNQISVRSLAMEILKHMGEEAIYPLKRLLKSESAEIRKIAVELMGDINTSQASRMVLGTLDDPDAMVRISAIEALGKQKVIQAVPKLLEYYDQYEQQRPAILNSLTKILLYWEKSIIRSEMLHTDPFLVISFLNSVQENGNITALNLIIQWLEQGQRQIGDELLKALESIVQKNPFITLPTSLFKIVKEIWIDYSGEMPQSVYLNCISHIPSSNVFNFLISEYEKNPSLIESEDRLVQYIERFFALFMYRYKKINLRTRLRILRVLIDKKAHIYDSHIIEIRNTVSSAKERELLLKLAVQGKLPEAKQILLIELSERKNSHVVDCLDGLIQYQDESLWHLFKRYVDNTDAEIQEKAIQGLVQYPEKTLNYLTQNPDPKLLNSKICLKIAMQLPVKYGDKFFRYWLSNQPEEREKLIKSYLLETDNPAYIPIIARYISDSHSADEMLSSLSKHFIHLSLPPEIRHFVTRLPQNEKFQIAGLLQKYWNVETYKWIPENTPSKVEELV